MPTRTFLDCSTGHLTPGTRARLDEIGTKLDLLPFAGGWRSNGGRSGVEGRASGRYLQPWRCPARWGGNRHVPQQSTTPRRRFFVFFRDDRRCRTGCAGRRRGRRAALASRHDGWFIAVCYGSENADYQIQRNDEAGKFECDGGAWEHVWQRAMADPGSNEMAALRWLKRMERRELVAIKKHCRPRLGRLTITLANHGNQGDHPCPPTTST